MISKVLSTLFLSLVFVTPAFAGLPLTIEGQAGPGYIITKNKIYIVGEIGDPTLYNGLILALDHCSEGSVDMYITSPGGNVITMYELADAIKHSPCKVDMHVRGLAASAAAVIAISGNSLEMEEGSLLMFHNISMGDYASLNHIQQRANAFEKSMREYLEANGSHVLTGKDINDIFEGKEVWITKKDLEARQAQPTVVSAIQKARDFVENIRKASNAQETRAP